jgi:tRNA(Ile)-lysidine synthase
MRESAPAQSGISAVRAVHVDHGLHADSAQWARHCESFARSMDVSCSVVRVAVDMRSGRGLEAAAREARYQAMSAHMQQDEVLLTAHHADDQLETLLMRMLRGTGVRGMRGIGECERFGRGWLARPLLPWRRAELAEVARAWSLTWLEDPANQDLRHDRSFLRSNIMPALTARWPAAARNAGRLARWMGDTEELLLEVAERDAAAAEGMPARCDKIAALDPARRRNVLRHLVRLAHLPSPMRDSWRSSNAPCCPFALMPGLWLHGRAPKPVFTGGGST